MDDPQINVHEEWKREFTADQLTELEGIYVRTRADRIRAAMFPETLPGIAQAQGDDIIPSTQYFKGHQTAVGKLAEPAQMLKQAIVNLINYQDDAEVASRAIPELIRLLQDTDDDVVMQAAYISHQMSRKEASRFPMIQHKNLIPAIIKAMDTSTDPRTHKDLAATLRNLSHHRQGLHCIYKNGGIPALIRLLQSNVDSVVFYAITTLHNLIRYQTGAKQAVQVAGGIKIMVALLAKDYAKFLAIDCDCLQMLCYGSQENKITALSAGCPKACIRILKQYNYEPLQWTCARLLKVLSVCTGNKPAIVENHGMGALGNILHSDSSRVVENALWTLRNLSDAAVREVGLNSLLETLVKFLNNREIAVLQCAAGILSNLTCNNPENKRIVWKANGVSLLVETMIRGGIEREELSEPCVCALRHLTSRHSDAESARNEVIQRNALPILANLLKVSRIPLNKAVIGLLRNMALSESNQNQLRNNEIVDLLCDKLNMLQNELFTDTTSRMVEGVTVEDIIEGTCGALHIFARYPENLPILKSHNTVHTAVTLLSRVSNQTIQRATTGLLCELAKDMDLASQIEQEPGALRQLTSLLHCKTEAVSAYAAATMYSLTSFKSDEDKKRMSVNLQASLFNQAQNEATLVNCDTLTSNYFTTTLKKDNYLPAQDSSRNYVQNFQKHGSFNMNNNSNTLNRRNNDITPVQGTLNRNDIHMSNNPNDHMAYTDRQQAENYQSQFGNENEMLLNDEYQLDTDL